MVSPPDSENPSTARAAEAHSDITQDGPTSADDLDAVPDLRLEPEVDSLSTFGPEHGPLEQHDSIPLHAPPTQAQPTRGDIVQPDTYIVWPVDDEDRSWWSRLRSLKASWETKRLKRSAHDEPLVTDADVPVPAARTGEVTVDAIRSLEKHLASLATLRDACASIDRRLAQIEDVSRQIEAAVQLTEETLHSREGIVAERLEEVSARMTARLAETEETIQRIERERVGETLRLTQQSLADSKVPEMCVNIEGQLAQARMALQRTEEAVADRTLHELCQHIDARLRRTEDTLDRREGVVTGWLQELSADMTARFAEAEEAIQRIERIVSSRTFEHTRSQELSPRTDDPPVQAEETPRAALVLSRFVNITHINRPIRQPWMARLAMPVLALVAALAIGALITTGRGVTPDKVVPLPTSGQVLTPVEQAPDQGIRAVSTTAVVAESPRSTRERQVSAPQPRSPDRKSAPTDSPSPRYVGTLSITSIPSGASVSINGKPAGVTPLRLSRQRAGSLAVQVAHDGFERWSAAVNVPADQLTQVSATLRASAR
jgi:hypothetical protein